MLIIRLFLLLFPSIPLLLLLLLPQRAQSLPNSAVSEITAPTIFIGHPPKNHYVILIPSPDETQIRSHFARIRDKVRPTGQIPFIAQNYLGRYIYASSFTERSQAENTRQRLLSDEPRARVVYFP